MSKTLYPLPDIPDKSDTICVQLEIPNDIGHRQAFLGAVYNLTRWYSWKQDSAHTALAAAERWKPIYQTLQQTMYSGCPCGVPDDGDCIKLAANHPSFRYAPNDPFQTPLYVPDGYLIPPWYTNPLIPLPGVQPGDAMVNGAAIYLGQPLTSGFPRVRLPFTGTGEVEIELVSVQFGGIALVVVDDMPTTAQFIDLGATLYDQIDSVLSSIFALFGVDFDGEVALSSVHQYDFTEPGDHHIDITFLPKITTVGEEYVIVSGGGFRSATICGGLAIGETPVPEMQVVDGCTIQWRPNSSVAWITLIENACGADGADGADGLTPIMQGIQDGDCHDIQWQYAPEQPETWETLITVCDGTNGTNGIDGADGICPDCTETSPDGEVPDVPEANRNFCRLAWGIFDNLTYYWRADLQKLYDLGSFPSATDLAVKSIIEDRIFNFSQLGELVNFYVQYTSLLDPGDIADYATAHEDRFDTSPDGESELIRNLIYCTLLANGSNITDEARAELAAQFLALEDSDGFWTSLSNYTLAVPDWAWSEWRLLGAYGYADPFFDCSFDCSGVGCDCTGETLVEVDAIADNTILVTEGERAPFESEVAFHMDGNGELEILLPARVCLKKVRISDPDGTVGPIDCELYVNGENLGEDDGGETLFQVWDDIGRECQTLKLVCPTHNEYIAYCHLTYCNEGE